MKYTLAFVNDVKRYRHSFFYIDEIIALMREHKMSEQDVLKVCNARRNRLSPELIFKILES